jgi:hypothetical protein
MGDRPIGMTLDRIDPTGNYEPENCRWADIKTQRANISAAGDQRMREGTSAAIKSYWRKWREERGFAPDETHRKRRQAGKIK